MPLTRNQIRQLYIADSERAKMKKEKIYQKMRNYKNINPVNRLLGGATSALSAYIASGGNPFAALASGASQAVANEDFQPLQAVGAGVAQGLGASNVIGSQADPSKILTTLASPENLKSTALLGKSYLQPEKSFEALSEIGSIYDEKNRQKAISKLKTEKINRDIASQKKEFGLKEKEFGLKERALDIQENKIANNSKSSDIEKEIIRTRRRALDDWSKMTDKDRKKAGTKKAFVSEMVNNEVLGVFPELKEPKNKGFFSRLLRGFGIGTKDQNKSVSKVTQQPTISDAKSWMLKNNIIGRKMTEQEKKDFLKEFRSQ